MKFINDLEYFFFFLSLHYLAHLRFPTYPVSELFDRFDLSMIHHIYQIWDRFDQI